MFSINTSRLLTVTMIGCAALSASPITPSGQFSLAGTVYASQAAFLFGYYQAPSANSADQLSAVLLPSQDVFGTLRAGEIAGIKNLLTPGSAGTFGPGPVTPGSSFLLTNFITLPDGIDIDLTGMAVSLGLPVCTLGITPGADFECRAQEGSPVILAQSESGVTAILNLVGRAHLSGSSTYTPIVGKLSANFTSGIDSTIDGLVTDFYRTGFIETSFSANISTTSIVPDPSTSGLVLFGLGIVCLGSLRLSPFLAMRRHETESKAG